MTKKILSGILLVCILVCTLTGCAYLDLDFNLGLSDVLIRGEKVTKEEWNNAFDLSTVNKMDVDFEINVTENEDLYQLKGTITYDKCMLRMQYTETEDGETENKYWEDYCYPLSFSDFEEIELAYFIQLFGELYDMFEYSNDNGAYDAVINFEDQYPLYVSIWFKDGKISKLVYSVDIESYGDFITLNATFKFKY